MPPPEEDPKLGPTLADLRLELKEAREAQKAGEIWAKDEIQRLNREIEALKKPPAPADPPATPPKKSVDFDFFA